MTIVAVDLEALATIIKREIYESRNALLHAKRAGDALIAAKQHVEHGGWIAWLSQHCDLSERVAQNYMRIASRWEDLQAKANRDSDLTELPVRAALKLLAEPKQDAPSTSESEPFLPLIDVDLPSPTPPTIDRRLVNLATTIRAYDHQAAIVRRDALLDLREAIDEALGKAGR